MVAAHRALVTLGATALRTYTDSTHIPNQPMIVILNLAIGGWMGYPTNTRSSQPTCWSTTSGFGIAIRIDEMCNPTYD